MRLLYVILLLLVIMVTFPASASVGFGQEGRFPLIDLQVQLTEALIENGAGEDIAVDQLYIVIEGDQRTVTSFERLPFQEKLAMDAVIRLMTTDFDPMTRRFSAMLQSEEDNTLFTVQGRFDIMVEIPVVAGNVHRGDIIREHDIAWVSVPSHMVRNNVVYEARELIGKEAKRSISANKPVNARDVTDPLLVEKGQLVAMWYKTPYMELKTLGHAMEDGSSGDVIRLKNTSTKAILQGRIEENGEVIVNYHDWLNAPQRTVRNDLMQNG